MKTSQFLMTLIWVTQVVAQDTQVVHRTTFAMGTQLRIECRADSKEKARKASELALRVIEACEKRLSTWLPESDLSRLNRCSAEKPSPLSAASLSSLQRSMHWVRETQGAFDPGAGAVFKLWGLRQTGSVPSDEERRRALKASGLARLSLGSSSATRPHPDFRIEAGAFGKGEGLDLAIAAVRKLKGVTAIELDFGGQLAWWQESGNFEVGIRHPHKADQLIATLSLPSQGSIATSGNGEQQFEVDGRRFGHLIDPRSGLPAADFGSLTVVAKSAFDADCLSTGLYVLGAKKALAFAKAYPQIDVVVCETQPDDKLSLHPSPGLESALQRTITKVETPAKDKKDR